MAVTARNCISDFEKSRITPDSRNRMPFFDAYGFRALM